MLMSAVGISAIGLLIFQGQGSLQKFFQAVPSFADQAGVEAAVEDGAKVTVQFHISPQDNPATSYSNTEQFVQGQHTVPPGIEKRMAGMHLGEVRTFPLSAEEGFGPHDERKLQIIPTIDLPLEAKEGDTLVDDAGTTAKIIWILPTNALIDFNHPLAGRPLIVTLQVVTIEHPTADAGFL
jgi:FKBP-type peptidyl-prolyl cis-trans isomerase 2